MGKIAFAQLASKGFICEVNPSCVLHPLTLLECFSASIMLATCSCFLSMDSSRNHHGDQTMRGVSDGDTR